MYNSIPQTTTTSFRSSSSNHWRRGGVSSDVEEERGCANCETKCDRACFPDFKVLSFTFTVSIAQILYFCGTWFASLAIHSNDGTLTPDLYFGPSFCVLYNSGAKWAPSIRYKYEIYRLVLPTFMHASLWHILINLFTQFRIMFVFEKQRVAGPLKLGIFYVFCGIGGTALSCLANPESLSIGASGALFGVFGLDVVMLATRWNQLNSDHRNVLALSLFILFVINFGIGFGLSGIVDVYAHLGGLGFGLVAGIATLNYDDKSYWRKWQILSFVCSLILLFGMVGGIWVLHGIPQQFPNCH